MNSEINKQPSSDFIEGQLPPTEDPGVTMGVETFGAEWEIVRLQHENFRLQEENTQLRRELDETNAALVAAEERADHDSKTNVLNFTAFMKLLENEVDSHFAEDVVVVGFIDINAFKEVNDKLGHLLGDSVLEALAKGLRSSDHIAARYGGDEFVIAGKLTNKDDKAQDPQTRKRTLNASQRVFENRVYQIIESTLRERLDEVGMTVADIKNEIPDFGFATGFASTLDGYTNAVELVEAADSAMYKVKRASKIKNPQT